MDVFSFSTESLLSLMAISFYFHEIFLFSDMVLENSRLTVPKRILASICNACIITVLISQSTIVLSFFQFLVIYSVLILNIMVFYRTSVINKFFFASAYFIHAMSLRSIITTLYSYASGLRIYQIAHNQTTLQYSYILMAVFCGLAIVCVRHLIPTKEIKIITQNKTQLNFMLVWITLFNVYLLIKSQIYDTVFVSSLIVFLQLVSPVFILLGLYIVLFFAIQTGRLLGYKEKTEVLQVQIEESEKQFEKMRIKAERDPLTGLYNKEVTSILIENYIAAHKNNNLCALFIIDIDYFKEVNDQKGHMYGDEVLIDLASKLSKIFRSDDIVGRIGGDEFMVFMKNVISEEAITSKADEVCKEFYQTYMAKNNTTKNFSASVGIAFYPRDGVTMSELYLKADEALYKVKENGRNSYRLYTSV